MSDLSSASVDRPRAAPRRPRVLAAVVLAGAAGTAGAVDTLRLAAARSPVSLPIYVAAQQGFFRDEGLDVLVDDCTGGQRCLRALADGKADLATSTEMPVVLRAFEGADLAILATITTASDNLKLVARRGGVAAQGEPLAGRHVGVVAGTASQYALETHLLAVGTDPKRVTMVPLQAEEVIGALRAGRIDAVAVWEPYGYEALAGPEPAGVRLPLAGGYIENDSLVAPRSLVATRGGVLARLLRALDRAEDFIQADTPAAQAILARRLKLDRHFVDWAWHGLGYRLALDQSLVTTMESEARWAQREGHVPADARLNVLTLVAPGPLKAVKPSAVDTGH